MPHQQPGRRLRHSASVLLLALAAGLTGCAAQQGYQNGAGSVVANSQGTPVGANLNGFLSQAAPGSTVVLQQSPWGANVEVMVDAPYYAASGRTCRQLQIRQQRDRMDFAVACETANGSWASHRLVTQTQAGRMPPVIDRETSRTAKSGKTARLSALLLATALLLPVQASAQNFVTSSTSLSGSQSQSQSAQNRGQSGGGQSGNVEAGPRASWQSNNYGPLPETAQPPKTEVDELPPFGANLFEGGFRGTMADGLNSSYQIKPGDQITLRAWGAVEIDRTMPVDAQGNIFIPSIGPIAVQGMNSQQLDAKIRQAIKNVYPQDVEVYTNLQGVQPVGVFVTGYVENPGRYAGTPSDSVLYFLDQAGGIDQELGSYRQIRVERNGHTVSTIDLYDFLLEGDIPRPQFKDGDTIVVEERGPAIAVTGDVKREYRYELQGQQLSGADVKQLARLNSGVSHVLLRGDRSDGPTAKYFALDEFSNQTVQSGDEVLFSSDKRAETIVVEVQGSYYGPSRYALPRDARLGELLDAISVPKDMSSVRDISILRDSVAEQQEAALEKSLRRLQTTYLGYPARTAEEGQIQVRQSELIERFVEEAEEVEPTGQLVVARGNGDIANVRLQDGDVINIPETNDAILLSGEVTMPQAVVYTPGMSVEDYIEQAGGFTPRADDDEVLVAHRNGAVVPADEARLRAGDEIIVLPAAPTSNLELGKSITQILYQIAVATKVALDI